MELKVVETLGAPTPGGAYSQGIRAGALLVVSGQVGIEPVSGVLPDGVVAQTKQALANLDAVIRAAGGTLSSLIKTTCFLTDAAAFAEFNSAYEAALGDHRPARSTVITGLAGGYRIEIEGIAVLDTAPGT